MHNLFSSLLSLSFVSATLSVVTPIAIAISPSSAKATDVLSCSKAHRQSLDPISKYIQPFTQGMVARPPQKSLFDFYLRAYFGDPRTDLPADGFDRVMAYLARYPTLSKMFFPKISMTIGKPQYDVPLELSKYIESKLDSIGRIKTQIYRPLENLSYWRKVLDWPTPEKPSELQRQLGKDASVESKQALKELKKR